MPVRIVVADSAAARILTTENESSKLVEAGDMIHSASRLKEKDLLTDRAGGNRANGGGGGNHAFDHKTDAQEHEKELFAGQLAREIGKICKKKKVLRLYLVAPPKFLGALRAELDQQTASLVEAEINKDLVNHSLEDIRRHLPKRL